MEARRGARNRCPGNQSGREPSVVSPLPVLPLPFCGLARSKAQDQTPSIVPLQMNAQFDLRIEMPDDAEVEGVTSIDFTTGNPKVEFITGRVHLYREQHTVSDRTTLVDMGCMGRMGNPPSTAARRHGDEQQQRGRGERHSLLPRDPGRHVRGRVRHKSAGHARNPQPLTRNRFCTFCGAYLSNIREMRVLRRESASARVVCMVLVRFDGAEHAASFFADCNSKPVRKECLL